LDQEVLRFRVSGVLILGDTALSHQIRVMLALFEEVLEHGQSVELGLGVQEFKFLSGEEVVHALGIGHQEGVLVVFLEDHLLLVFWVYDGHLEEGLQFLEKQLLELILACLSQEGLDS
jgi:hypothetical protein